MCDAEVCRLGQTAAGVGRGARVRSGKSGVAGVGEVRAVTLLGDDDLDAEEAGDVLEALVVRGASRGPRQMEGARVLGGHGAGKIPCARAPRCDIVPAPDFEGIMSFSLLTTAPTAPDSAAGLSLGNRSAPRMMLIKWAR